MNNTLEGITSRITEAEGQISDLEDRMVEVTAAEHEVPGILSHSISRGWPNPGPPGQSETFKGARMVLGGSLLWNGL